jgi:hypothetical protein
MKPRPLIVTSPDWAVAKVLRLELVELDLLNIGNVLAAMQECDYPEECLTPEGALLFSLMFTADRFRESGIGGSDNDSEEGCGGR